MRAIRLAGLAMVLSLGAASLAQAQRPAQAQRSARGDHGGRHGQGFGALLKGIQLTDQQKSQLKDLRKQQGKGNKGQFDNVREQVKAARESGDTAKLHRLRADMQTQMKQRREQMIQSIRGVLTADQRQVFDRNVADAQVNRRGRAGS